MIKQKIRERELKDIVITNIILDCSCINYLDSQGVHAIETLYDSYKEMNISLSISFCKSKQFLKWFNYLFISNWLFLFKVSIKNLFKKVGVKDSFSDVVFYPSTFDAVMDIFKNKFPDKEIIYSNEINFSGQYGLIQDANSQCQSTDENTDIELIQEANSQFQNTDENKDIESIQDANSQYQITDEKYSKEEQQEDTEEEQQEAPLYDEYRSYTGFKESFWQTTSLWKQIDISFRILFQYWLAMILNHKINLFKILFIFINFKYLFTCFFYFILVCLYIFF